MKGKKVLEGIVIVSTIAGAGNSVSANPMEFYSDGEGLGWISYFTFELREGANEKFVPGEDGLFLPGIGKRIDLSSCPYPYTQLVSDDLRNRESTLPLDITAVLEDTSSSHGYIYINILDPNDYLHRNLTIQEVDPNNPNDPNNTNQIQNVLDLPIDPIWEMYKYDAGNFQQNVVRMFRIGVYTNPRGDVDEDGQVDFNDISFLADGWLDTTYDSNGVYIGNNYDEADKNHDGFIDFIDFAIIGADWYKDGDGNSISKLMVPGLDGEHLKALQRDMVNKFYGDKAQPARIFYLVRLPQNRSIAQNRYHGGVIPQLAALDNPQSQLENTLNENQKVRPRFRVTKGPNGQIKKHYRENPQELPYDNQPLENTVALAPQLKTDYKNTKAA